MGAIIATSHVGNRKKSDDCENPSAATMLRTLAKKMLEGTTIESAISAKRS